MPPLVIDLLRNDQLPDHLTDGFARVWATYKARPRDVKALAPDRPNKQTGQDPVVLLDEATIAMAMAAWEAGALVGAAFADAEAAFDYAVRVCRSCDGSGQIRGEERGCPTCRGEGTVAADKD